MDPQCRRSTPKICEVGPRDGIQNEKTILSLEDRIALVNQLGLCGIDRIEVGSFVNPRSVPQMANTDRVLAGIRRAPGVQYAALALNVRGGLMALDSGVDRVHFAFASSETFNQRNQGSTVSQSVAAFEEVCRVSSSRGLPVTAILATAFGCPFEGPIPVDAVVRLAAALAERGADEIVLADTIGAGVPIQVERLFGDIREALGTSVGLGAHFHDTRGTGIGNADAAIRSGADILDASVGGFGGCPFAPMATGNIATEDLGYLLRQSGLPSRLVLEKLIDTGAHLARLLGHTGSGAIARAGLFPEIVSTESVVLAG